MLSNLEMDDIGYDPFDVQVMTNPHPYYKRLRNEQPVYFTPRYDTFWLSRFQDIVQMLSIGDNALVSSESSMPMPEVLLKHHEGQSPRASLDPIKLYDIDPSQAPDVLATVNAITIYDPERGGVDNSPFFTKLKRFMVPSIVRRRAAGADGQQILIDGLINYRLEPDSRLLTDDEIADELTCAFIGNTETPGKVAAQGLMALFGAPEQLALVRADLSNNTRIVTEEMLRYAAPAQWVLRTVHKDVVIADVSMRVGQRVAGLIACANRDEREFHEPDKFIWNRPIRRQLAFGLGLHHCMGLHITRLQIRVCVEEFLKRVDACRFLLNEAILKPSYFHWAYSSLPVEIL